MKDALKKALSIISTAAVAASVSGCTGGNDTASADDILIDEIIDEPVETIIIDEPSEEITEASEEIFEETTASAESETFTEAAEEPERSSGTVLRIASYNDELKDVFELLYGEENLPDGISFEYESYSNFGSEYIDMLNNSIANDEEPIDIFLVEPDYILPFINSDITLPLYEAGITGADTSDMFPYTISTGTSYDGILKAVSWQTEPGVFVYRRDIAMDVFGNDDPKHIHELISSDWEGTASALAEKGYYIVSSADETYRLYGQDRTAPWTDGSGNIFVDSSCRLWAEDMRRDIQNGFNPDYSMWTDRWISEQSSTGNTFGFCLASWYSEQIIPMWSDSEAYGKFGVCLPPKPYYWGGAYLCISSRTDNIDLCGEVIKKLTCDSENMIRFTEEMRDCCNSRSALKSFAESGLGYFEFYGQDTFEVYLSAAEAVEVSNVTPYDMKLDDYYMGAMYDYFGGYITYEEAENNFYEKASDAL